MTADRLLRALRFAAATAVAAFSIGAQAATFQLYNLDGPGVGFNDLQATAPVGGNPGTTLGEQRQIVFLYAAQIWGEKLKSDVPIQWLATFEPLRCDATSGVLGAAGPWNVISDFPNAGKLGTWYPSSLANKQAGVQIIPGTNPLETADIISFFNGDLGVRPGCLDGLSFYLGLDGKAGADQIDLLTTVLHEVGHGLGFLTFSDETTGKFFFELPTITDHNLFDPAARKTWANMTDAERVTSAVTPRNLVWNGRTVTRKAERVLDRGTAELYVAGPGLDRFMLIGLATFGPPIDKRNMVVEAMAAVVDQPDGRGLACNPLDARNAHAVRGKVAVVDRGGCVFTQKVKNAQLAGAKAVIVVDTGPGVPHAGLPGTDATITIPSVRVTPEDGAAIKASIGQAKRHKDGPFAVLFENQRKLAGADYLRRVYMYTPSVLSPGSSVSHFDTLATPNLLMEPFAEPNQPIAVSSPLDLTLEFLRDIGW